ncbi:MAG: hypothetical protein AB7P99_08140 [Vicinamibacterales bacterium]
MALILTVEPDRTRAAQLEAMARAHLDAEFIAAPSVARGFQALGERVPDLLLLAPLLPAAEEAALDDYLRLIGPAAAHVRSLTIPLLAGGRQGGDRGLLSALRRERSRPADADGCDPSAFAEQIAHYLRDTMRQAPPVKAEAEPEPTDEPIDKSIDEPVDEGPLVDLSALLEAEPEPDFAIAPEPVIEIEPEAILELAPEPEAEPDPAPDPVIELPPVELAPVPMLMKPAPAVVGSAPLPALVPVAPVPAAPLAPVLAPAMVQQVIEVPTGTGAQVQASVAVNVAVSVQVAAAVNVSAAPKRKGKPRPIQDEWGFFDPGQCGFQALMARLDEIAATEERDDA